MADNYLGRKMEEYFARPAEKPHHKAGALHRLLTKNRSVRGFDATFHVREDQMRRILEVNTRIASAGNAQTLRFRPVMEDEADKVLPHIKLGKTLAHLNLPYPGTEPKAYVVICSTTEESRYVDIDMGISVQSMLLQATEIGLSGVCIAMFDSEALQRDLGLELRPLLVVALGKSAERIELRPIRSSESTKYWREDGVHYVPKIVLDDLILPRPQK